MSWTPNDRWQQLGVGLVTLGSTAMVSYWIYTLQADSNHSFWELPGTLSVGATALGFVFLFAAFVDFRSRDEGDRHGRINQRQRSGKKSLNIQASGDIALNAPKPDKKDS